MGGEGSGRRPDPIKTLIGFNQPIGEPDTLYIPNYSGIKKGAVKQTDVPIPLLAGDIANKSYVDSQISGENHWDDDGTYLHPYYPARGLYLSGSVGIGTTVPTKLLQVASPAATESSLMLQQTGQNNWIMGMAASSADLRISDSNLITNPYVTVKATTGNVGIGTTSPGSLLHLSSAGTDAAQLRFTNTGGGTTHYIAQRTTGLNFGELGVADGQLFIQNGGNVGIGETSIDARLHVSSPINTVSNIKIEQVSTASWRIGSPASLTYFVLASKNDDLSSPALVVDTNSNVGIGTTSPTDKLYVAGAITATGQISGASFVGGTITTLQDNSMADTLHRHSELSASDGTPDAILKVDAAGLVGIGVTPIVNLHVEKAANNIAWSPDANRDVAIFGGNPASGTNLVLVTATTEESQILFASPTVSTIGRIRYEMATNKMAFYTNAGERFALDATGGAAITNAGTTDGLLIDQNGSGIGLNIDNEGTLPCITLQSNQDVEVIDFDGCTDGGTSHLTLSGSLKVQMPNGSTGYINFYT